MSQFSLQLYHLESSNLLHRQTLSYCIKTPNSYSTFYLSIFLHLLVFTIEIFVKMVSKETLVQVKSFSVFIIVSWSYGIVVVKLWYVVWVVNMQSLWPFLVWPYLFVRSDTFFTKECSYNSYCSAASRQSRSEASTDENYFLLKVIPMITDNTVNSRYFDFAYMDNGLSQSEIWSLFKYENLTRGNKILWKRGEIAPTEQFLLFFTMFST